jgi:hypothetical protein
MKFLTDVLHFNGDKRGDYWWASNDSMAALLQPGEGPAKLYLQCTDVAADAARLLANPSVREGKHPLQQCGNLLWQSLDTDCGLCLYLCRALNEDEMGELLPLPANIPWDDAVDAMVRRVLRIVPVDFRTKARQRVTERAEYLTLEQGALLVDEAAAVRALQDITLDFQQRSLYEALRDEGVTVSHYFSSEPEPCGDD